MTATERAPYDVLTMGRVGVDLYPLQAGLALPDVTTFGKFLGGNGASNCGADVAGSADDGDFAVHGGKTPEGLRLKA